MYRMIILLGIALVALAGIGFLGVALANEDALPGQTGERTYQCSGPGPCGGSPDNVYCGSGSDCAYGNPGDCPNYGTDEQCPGQRSCGGC